MASRLILLDNTVLTNFALVGRAGLVTAVWRDAGTTAAVMAEYQVGVTRHGLPAHSWHDLTQLTLQPVEQAFIDQLPPRLGAGERSCIAIAVHRQGLFACDDALARREAQQLGVTITGTIGILVLTVRQSILTPQAGNDLLANMIAQGYRSPITRLDDLL